MDEVRNHLGLWFHQLRGIFDRNARPIEGVARVSNDQFTASRRLDNINQKNDELLDKLFKLTEEKGWEEIRREDDIVIWRKRMPPELNFGGGDAWRAEKFYAVMAKATINAPAHKLFQLFRDNSRVPEYNEHCQKLRDLEYLDKDTKISWSATGRFGGGVFKARDFVTRVHYRIIKDRTFIVVNRPEEHEDARPTNQYVRAEVLLAGNVMKVRKDDPNKTDFMVITHVNPGGIADTALGSKVVNMLCANSPITFINSLQNAVHRTRG
eukprot:Plantae.Rhodophyta-Purpureofilum_apyrenoidigerum.ctg22373.p1 GENE.Plantae.Rhodophyta-Purpureofilum_apyrenoidigerum.ctg22373~~Plantae.Rhodophyta-Purpureofilum_apyrenoidigerum.ctg22373.p1  ORF type:complete len:284 (+),score=61.83 Plantae.Rhodophyta-Purpureofilum_apyrenoidigerum.ctg22373:53-853(+)